MSGAPEIAADPRAPAPLRRWVYPQAGDDWARVAERELPDLPRDEAIAALQSWNLYLAFRPVPAMITPTDILFVEPPRTA